jgi:hypothetical protein
MIKNDFDSFFIFMKLKMQCLNCKNLISVKHLYASVIKNDFDELPTDVFYIFGQKLGVNDYEVYVANDWEFSEEGALCQHCFDKIPTTKIEIDWSKYNN